MLGVILAGGRSSRMGTDKSRLMFREQTLLQHQQQVLHQLGLTSVVSGPDGIHDDFPDYPGPLAGIYSVIRQCPADKWLFVPVDLPLLVPGTLEKLINHPASQGCCFDNHPLPLLLRNSEQLIPQLYLRLTQAGANLSVRAFARSLNIELLPPTSDDNWHLSNANDPQQWQALLTQVQEN